jgi:hypothetical protein
MPTFDVSTNPDRVPFSQVLLTLAELARAKAASMLLVGATARDIALAADAHAAPLRATNDVDIAVAGTGVGPESHARPGRDDRGRFPCGAGRIEDLRVGRSRALDCA